MVLEEVVDAERGRIERAAAAPGDRPVGADVQVGDGLGRRRPGQHQLEHEPGERHVGSHLAAFDLHETPADRIQLLLRELILGDRQPVGEAVLAPPVLDHEQSTRPQQREQRLERRAGLRVEVGGVVDDEVDR